MDDFDKWYDAGHIKEANLNLTGKNIMPVQNDKGKKCGPTQCETSSKNELSTDRMLDIDEHKYIENNEINNEQINNENENLKMDEEEETDWLKYLDFC
uniref:Candidate secreted effector n=1 Tax=Meloidogyne incognita TaxID=6306 RepID=A0A914L030_MELIC